LFFSDAETLRIPIFCIGRFLIQLGVQRYTYHIANAQQFGKHVTEDSMVTVTLVLISCYI